jgi:hypothetical protein
MDYKFESEYFAISDSSFHLLRSRFNFKTYKNNEVSQVILERGKLVNNWIVILTLGMSLISFSLFFSYRLYYLLNTEQIPTIYIEEIVVPVIPFLFGIYCIYAALRSGPTIRVSFIDDKKKRFPLDKIEKNGNLDVLKNVLKDVGSLKNKVIIRI